MQTQLANLHEKHGQEVLKSEQLETLNKENQKIIGTLKSDYETLSKTKEQLDKLLELKKWSETIKIKTPKNTSEMSNLERTESLPNLATIRNDQFLRSREIMFYIECPSHTGETSVNTENFEILPNISGSFELILKRKENGVSNPLVCIKPKVTSMISCHLSVAVFVLNQTKKNSAFVCRSKT